MDAKKMIESKAATIEDIYALPEGERAELIDGKLYMMASPRTKHQVVLGRLYREIANYIDSRNGDCEVIMAPFAVFLNGDDTVYVEPDISAICDKSKVDDEGCKGAPDWVIEIVSPSNPGHDYLRKLNLYMTKGVREYWIVDPDKNQIFVYNFENETMEQYTFSDTVKAGIYEDFAIDFSSVSLK